MVVQLNIALADNRTTYYSGEWVRGIAQIQTDTLVPVVELHFYGEAKCHWTVTRGTKENRQRYRLSSYEPITQWQNALTNQGQPFQPGSYQVPFELQLPLAIPSSMEGQYGFIRYFVSIQIPGGDGLFGILSGGNSRAFQKIKILRVIDTNLPQFLVFIYLKFIF